MTNKLKCLYNCITDKNEKPNWNQVSPENISVKTLWRQYDRLKISNGMLYREWIDVIGISNRLQLVVPDQLKHEILQYYHDVPSAGHLGTEKTSEKIKLSFY